MDITRVRSLVHNEVPLGLRFNTDQGIFDADRASLRKHGLLTINLPAQVILELVGDSFVSQEDASGVSIRDISEDTEVLMSIINTLKSQGNKRLFTLQPVHHQSLKVFLNDPDWEAIRVQRNDEHNNQHNLRQPDGKMWSQGWIGKAKSPLQAKAVFHHEQVFWALHRSIEVKPEALLTYSDLQNVVSTLQKVKATVSISDDDIVSVSVNGDIIDFPLSDWPDRVYIERQFARESGLVANNLETHMTNFISLEPIELTIMGIRYVIKAHCKVKGYPLQGGK